MHKQKDKFDKETATINKKRTKKIEIIELKNTII